MIKTSKELVAAALMALRCETVYALGAFGWPMNEANKQRVLKSYAFNNQPARLAAIMAATAVKFGFDCICFIKALLWGWCGDASKEYGGAVYQSNGIPDIDEKAMLELCKDVSEDFSNILPGEYLWTDGHCGVYLGNGKAAEATYRWDDGVQETTVYNITGDIGGKGRYWKKHGKLPGIVYEAEEAPKVEEEPVTGETDQNKYSLVMRNLRRGDEGEDVRSLQLLLIGNDCSCGGTGADGDFGANTEAAVKKYQRKHGLVEDGIAGKLTMGSLLGVDA